MIVEVFLGGMVICLFVLSLFFLSPKASLASAFLGFSLLGTSLYMTTGWTAGVTVIILSLYAILGIALQSIMYFDLEKEFQRQYKKDITSIFSIIFSVILFGILIIFVTKNALVDELIKREMRSFSWSSIAHGGEYIFIGMGILVMLMIISGIALVNSQGDEK